MKKGITSEAAGRLAAFMKERAAQQGYNPEDWSPADAAQDALWEIGQKVQREFSGPVWVMESDVMDAFNNATDHAMEYLEERLQALIEEMTSVVSAAGFPAPDPSFWEGLKQRYAQQLEDEVVAVLKQQMYETFEKMAVDIGSDYYETVIKEFQKAAGGQGGVTP